MNCIQILLEGRKTPNKKTAYSEYQIQLAYTSNWIEGNVLTLDQVRSLYWDRTILVRYPVPQIIPVSDIIETINHFEAFDYVLDTLTANFNHSWLKELHRILRKHTDDEVKGYPVGNYKAYSNMVGGQVMAEPHMVMSLLDDLFKEHYFMSPEEFHYRYERIHPFQDGNGRTGRLLLMRKALNTNRVPYLIG